MDFEYKGCLNPILAYNTLSNKFVFYKYSKDKKKDKIKIIGNLKYLNKKYNNVELLKLMSDPDVIKLPCRHCINCQLKRSREWSVRASLEAKSYDDSLKWFITLTYDDEHLPKTIKSKLPTLLHSHISNFMKSLRSKYPKSKIRFFGSGEYGSLGYRPHYHILLYGAPFKNSDFEFLYSQDNFNYYRCKPIEESWQKGITVVSNFSDFNAQYVAEYTTKKLSEYHQPYFFKKEMNIVPEFLQMSRNPGIAVDYYNSHKEEFYIKNNDTLIFHKDYKTMHLKPFKIFDNLYDLENKKLLQFFKENRKVYGQKYDFFKRNTFAIPIYEYLTNLERKIKHNKKGGNGLYGNISEEKKG